MSNGIYWVVSCKNLEFHAETDPFHTHKIPIGRTDEHSTRPTIPDYLDIQCDDKKCGKTYKYTAPEIIRWEGNTILVCPHPLFDWP
jgi:hypothetical protein